MDAFKKLLFILFFSSVFSFSSIHAQKTNDANLKKTFEKAQDFFYKEQYENALPLFLTVEENLKDNSNLNFKIGLCYYNSRNDKIKSVSFLEKAVKNVSEKYNENSFSEHNAPLISHFYLGKVYALNYEFDKAIEAFQIFKLYLNKEDLEYSKKVEREIEMCNNGKILIISPIKVSITNLGPAINSQYPEYSPLLTADENYLLYTSRRPSTTGGKKALDGLFYEDIFISQKLNEWQPAKNISKNINTSNQEATAGLSFDGEMLFIYRAKGSKGTLYKSELKGQEWSEPELIDPYQDINDWKTHATLSANRDVIYYVSDMPDGYGGKDIWMSKILPDDTWGLPINLGPEVNTPYDEEAPFLHPGGKFLFFSSQGHNSMGGFDIFFVEQNEEGNWGERLNLGYPINTPDDDVFYVTSPSGKRSYFSSNRSGGYGDQDIYMASMEDMMEKPLTILTGCVKPSGKQDMLSKIVINVVNNETEEEFVYRPNSASGKFIMALNIGTYKVSYQYADIEFYSEDIFVTEWIFNILNKDIELNLVQVNDDCLQPDVIMQDKNIPLDLAENKKENNSTSLSKKETKEDKVVSIKEKKNLNLNEIKDHKKEILTKKNTDKYKTEASATVRFDFNKDKLNGAELTVLNNLLNSVTDKEKLKVEISGHTDGLGKASYNKTLSERRAKSVKTELIKLGFSSKKINSMWYGAEQAIADNETEDGRALNRRVEIILYSPITE